MGLLLSIFKSSIAVGDRRVTVVRRLGEGGFGIVDLVHVWDQLPLILLIDPQSIDAGPKHGATVCIEANQMCRRGGAQHRCKGNRKIRAVPLKVRRTYT